MATKKAAKTIRRAPVPRPAPPAVDQAETALYEVLRPFKFRGGVVKPPAFVEMTADEAREYQEAGVLGTEPGELPAPDADDTNT